MSRGAGDSLLSEGVRKFNAGRVRESIADFSAAIRHDPEDSKGYYFRSFAYKSAGDHAGALRDIVRMIELQETSPGSGEQAAYLLADLGLLEKAFALAPTSAPVLIKAAGILKDHGDGEAALRHCLEAVRRAPRSVLAHILLAEMRLTLGILDGVEPALRRALALVPRSNVLLRRVAGLFDELGGYRASRETAVLLRRVAELFEEMGDYRAAREIARRAVRADPGSPAALTRLARLELWHGRSAEAAAWAGRALALEPRNGEALRVRGAAAVLRRRWRDAAADLDQALRSDPRDAEAFIWRAEAARRQGEHARALKDIASSRRLWPSSMGALVNEELSRIALGLPLSVADHSYILSRVPKEIAPLRERSSIDRPAEVAPLLERTLVAMRGNRSITTSFAWRGRLVRHIHYFPRDPLVALQAAVRFGDVDRVLRQFARLLRRTPGEAYLYSHRAEVFMWAGRYHEARRDFQRARGLNDFLLWPKVGLSAVHMLLGEYEQSLELMDYAATHGGSDSIMLPWRGESLRRLGRPAEALKEFAKWKEAMPFRPAVWLNRALAMLALGDAKGAARLASRLRRRVPAFMAEAERRAGTGALKPVLEKALESMCGNRSSWMYTYFDAKGRVQPIRMRGVDPAKVPAGVRGFFDAFYREGPRP